MNMVMKKAYIQPTMRCVCLHHKPHLVVTSVESKTGEQIKWKRGGFEDSEWDR